MICKNCQKEMPDVGDFCPFCATPKNEAMPQEAVEAAVLEVSAEETPAEEAPKKKKKWPLVLGIVGGSIVLLALIALLTGFILNSLGVDILAFLKPQPQDVTYKTVYEVNNEQAVANADKVVATISNRELTNAELQIYYQNEIDAFLNSDYYVYMYYMGQDVGPDLTQPLSQQQCSVAENRTWEQYFLELALNTWEQYTLLSIQAEAESFQLDTELQTTLDEMPTQLSNYAISSGFDDADAYLQNYFGVSVSTDTYLEFFTQYCFTNDYISSFYENRYPTIEEIEVYYVENESTFAENNVDRDMGLQSSVRHILIAPDLEEATEETEATTEEATTEEATEETEATGETTEETVSAQDQEAWDAALQEAQALLDAWKAGEATEDSFAALVADNTDDTASIEAGGLYEDINADSNYVPEFLNWAIDAARQPGDTEIVKTDYGYHIMYFVSGEDYWSIIVGKQLVAERIKTVLEQAKEVYTISTKYKYICLAPINFG